MTAAEAKARQEELAFRGFSLGWWYGTRCVPCCGVFPRLQKTADLLSCFYECEVCGKRTEPQTMPWIAEEVWNRHEYREQQMSLF